MFHSCQHSLARPFARSLLASHRASQPASQPANGRLNPMQIIIMIALLVAGLFPAHQVGLDPEQKGPPVHNQDPAKLTDGLACRGSPIYYSWKRRDRARLSQQFVSEALDEADRRQGAKRGQPPAWLSSQLRVGIVIRSWSPPWNASERAIRARTHACPFTPSTLHP